MTVEIWLAPKESKILTPNDTPKLNVLLQSYASSFPGEVGRGAGEGCPDERGAFLYPCSGVAHDEISKLKALNQQLGMKLTIQVHIHLNDISCDIFIIICRIVFLIVGSDCSLMNASVVLPKIKHNISG